MNWCKVGDLNILSQPLWMQWQGVGTLKAHHAPAPSFDFWHLTCVRNSLRGGCWQFTFLPMSLRK